MKFLLVDDHALIREALRGVLGSSQRRRRARGGELPAGDGLDRSSIPISRSSCSICGLPDRDGFDVLAELRERLSRHLRRHALGLQRPRQRRQGARSGALGFIPKTASRDVLLGALRLVLAGGIYIPPDILAPRPAGAALAGHPGGRRGARRLPSSG